MNERLRNQNKIEFKREVSFRYCTLGLHIVKEPPGVFYTAFLEKRL